MRTREPITQSEAALLAATILLAGIAVAAPAVAAAPAAHGFADQRSFLGILYAADVLSNIAFALAALAGFAMLWRAPVRAVGNVHRAMAVLFFGGLLLVALGSASYHLDPTERTLAGQRYCIAVAFAGVLGLAAAERVSARAGAWFGLGLLGLGLLSVRAAEVQGNELPWLVLQAGGVVTLWWLSALRRRVGTLGIDFLLILLAYGAARLLEVNDAAIFEATGRLVSGHALSHLAAAFTVWPVLSALHAAIRHRPERAPLPIAADVAMHWWRDA